MHTDDSSKIDYVTSLSAISGFMLYNIRKAMGLGQADMGKLFNMSHATYRSIERGETAINVDFIFMLCSIIELKFSNYFMLVEDIADFLTKVEKDAVNNPCEIRLVPNGDFQKLLNICGSEEHLVTINTNMPNILHDQDFNLFFSPEIRGRILKIVNEIIVKNDFSNMVKIKSNEVGEVIEVLKSGTAVLATPHYASSTASISLLGALGSPFSLPVIAGLGLYAAYKKSKEDRASRK